MSRPWLGSKGSWYRKAKISSDKHQDNWDKAFGKKVTWLQLKHIKEAWLCTNSIQH